MKCPVCQKHELVKQSLEDCSGDYPDIFCPEVVDIGNGKKLNHYRRFVDQTRIIILPFRIITDCSFDDDTFRSNIGFLSKYKSGKPYFKTLMKLPEIHSDTEEKLLNRIKTLLLFS